LKASRVLIDTISGGREFQSLIVREYTNSFHLLQLREHFLNTLLDILCHSERF
jgi:hypothetical protein